MTQNSNQPHRLTDRVKILHKIAVLVDGKVLILKRHGQAHSRPDQWDLPGGNAEWPASKQQSIMEHLHRGDVVRELMEETGIQQSPEVMQQPVFFDTFFEPAKPMYTVAVGWRLILPQQPNVSLSREHTQSVWVTASDISSYDFGFAGGPDGFLTQIISLAFKQP